MTMSESTICWAIRIKVVPDAAPNADGEWLTLHNRVLLTDGMRFNEVVDEISRLSEDIPNGHHIVQYEVWR